MKYVCVYIYFLYHMYKYFFVVTYLVFVYVTYAKILMLVTTHKHSGFYMAVGHMPTAVSSVLECVGCEVSGCLEAQGHHCIADTVAFASGFLFR